MPLLPPNHIANDTEFLRFLVGGAVQQIRADGDGDDEHQKDDENDF